METEDIRQIEDPKNPIADPYKAYAPESLGAIPPAWEPRLPLGGAYDDHWQKNIWPEWPPDYSFAYHNSAHPGLICDGYLAGDERISMVGFQGANEPRMLAAWNADQARLVRRQQYLQPDFHES